MNLGREDVLNQKTALAANTKTAALELYSDDVIGGSGRTCLILSVDAVSGTTPTLDLDVIAMIAGDEIKIHSFTQITAVGVQKYLIEVSPHRVKLDYTVGGTNPSFDLKVYTIRS